MKQRRRDAADPNAQGRFANQPFRGLKQAVAAAAPQVKAAPPPPKPPPVAAKSEEVDAEALFAREMSGVRPLQDSDRQRIEGPTPASEPREITSEDAEALAELSDLVSGNLPFDITQSDEHVEGFVVGLDPRLLRRLRKGEFVFQAHIDLHGMTSEEAREKVDEFLQRSQRAQKRCVLIVHGRGLNSKDQVPVLKTRLTSWLTRGRWAHSVLAFTSARPCDGGVGALYVLLRRDRSARAPMQVTNGAKW